MNNSNDRPIYSLSVSEFSALIRNLVLEVVKDELSQRQQPEPHTEEKNEHFTIQELTKFLRCSRMSIYNYKKLGLPFYRLGRKILFKKNEVMEFMHRCLGRDLFGQKKAGRNP